METKDTKKDENLSLDEIIKGCERELSKDEKELIEYINSLSKEQCEKVLEVLNKIEETQPLFKGKTKKYIDLLMAKI
jgi:hypothetical protein